MVAYSGLVVAHSRALAEKRFLHSLRSVEMTGGRRYARPFGPRYDNLDVMNDRGAEDTLGPSGLGMTERQGLGMTICVMARCPIRSGMTLGKGRA